MQGEHVQGESQFENIPRNLAPFLRWISRFAAPLGIVKPPRPEEAAVPDAAADVTAEAEAEAEAETEVTIEAGAEADGEAVADALPDDPAVTVTYTISVTVTESPAPEVGFADPGRVVMVGMLVTSVSAGAVAVADAGALEGEDELPGAPEAAGAPPVAVAEPEKMEPTSPCSTFVMMAVRLAKSETAMLIASCCGPRAYLDSASAASAVSAEDTSTSMQVV